MTDERTKAPRRECHRAAVPAALVCMLIVIVTAAGCDWLPSATRHRGPPVVVGDTLLRYPDGSTFAPGLHDLVLVGHLPAATAAPFVIVAGRECERCVAGSFVTVLAPSGGPVRDLAGLREWHAYPGRTRSDDGTVVAEGRLFWGSCVPQRPPAVISYRTEFGGPGEETLREVRITEVHGDSLLQWRMVPQVAVLTATLLQVRARQCTELDPREVTAP